MPPQFIDHPDGGLMLAPLEYPNAHEMTLDEIEQHFVNGAPYEAERKELLNALHTYSQAIWRIFPDAELWVNGGFCTLKNWEAPEDVDIAVGISGQDVLMLNDPSIDLQIKTLVTREIKSKTGEPVKVRALGDQIDAFVFPMLPSEQKQGPLNLGLEEHRYYDLWARVKGKNGTELFGVRKGFIKVVKPCLL